MAIRLVIQPCRAAPCHLRPETPVKAIIDADILWRTPALRGKGFARDAGIPDFRSLASRAPCQAGRSPSRIAPLRRHGPAPRPCRIEAPHRRPQSGRARTMHQADTPKVLNKKRLRGFVPNSVYIGRPSIWGNPFVLGKDGNRWDVITKYERWLAQQPHLLAQLDRLRGRHLVCWCTPQPCHGDVLLRLANAPTLRCL